MVGLSFFSVIVSALPWTVELQRLTDTREFASLTDGMAVTVLEVELDETVEGPLYTGYDRQADVCVIYHNTSKHGREGMKRLLSTTESANERRNFMLAVMAHEVAHCLYDHESETRLKGISHAEDTRRIETESDIFGLMATKKLLSPADYAVVYRQFLDMRKLETEPAHSTWNRLSTSVDIKPDDE